MFCPHPLPDPWSPPAATRQSCSGKQASLIPSAACFTRDGAWAEAGGAAGPASAGLALWVRGRRDSSSQTAGRPSSQDRHSKRHASGDQRADAEPFPGPAVTGDGEKARHPQKDAGFACALWTLPGRRPGVTESNRGQGVQWDCSAGAGRAGEGRSRRSWVSWSPGSCVHGVQWAVPSLLFREKLLESLT